VGGLYAVGYTAAQLDTIVRTEDWYRLLTDPVDRRDLAVDRKFTEDHYLLTLPIQRGGIKLPRSVVAGQRVSQLLTRLTWSAHAIRDFRALPIPFAAVATDPLEPRDSIVSLVDVLVQSVSFRVWDSEAEQRSKCDVVILPDVRGFSTFGFTRASEVIARGEVAARAALPRIEAALAQRRVSRRPRAQRAPVVEPESVFVTAVRFDPADLVPEGFLSRTLGVRPGAWVSRGTLDQ